MVLLWSKLILITLVLFRAGVALGLVLSSFLLKIFIYCGIKTVLICAEVEYTTGQVIHLKYMVKPGIGIEPVNYSTQYM